MINELIDMVKTAEQAHKSTHRCLDCHQQIFLNVHGECALCGSKAVVDL